jgi:hypothetical protein
MKNAIYPSWRYHKELEPKIIHHESEEAEGWLESPAMHESAQEIGEPEQDELPKQAKKSKKEKPELEKEA